MEAPPGRGRPGADSPGGERRRLERERTRLALRVGRSLEVPMLVLALAWLALTTVELTRGLSPLLARSQQVIWGIFLAEFGLRLLIAPHKPAFLGRSWLTLVSLFLPALRLLRVARLARVLRAARAARGLRLVKVIGSLNRGMRALGRALSRRGAGYVAGLTLVVTTVGAAGIFAFERGPDGLATYGDALWWTAMLMTTLGSEYWPRTAEGRLLTLLLALYAFAVFGYLTAALASFFVERDTSQATAPTPGEMDALRHEIARLREEIAGRGRFGGSGGDPAG